MKLYTCAIAAVLLTACGGSSALDATDDGTGSFGEGSGESSDTSSSMGTSTSGSDSGGSCGVVGQQVSCPCPGDAPDGVQVCQDDGTYSECMGCDGGTSTTGMGSTDTGSTDDTGTSGDETGSTDDTGTDETGTTGMDWPDDGSMYAHCTEIEDCDSQVCSLDWEYCTIQCFEPEDCPDGPSGTAEPFCSMVSGFSCALECTNGDCPQGMDCVGFMNNNFCVWS